MVIGQNCVGELLVSHGMFWPFAADIKQFFNVQYHILHCRANHPDKTEEEKALMAKKLAEQRAKTEGIPTTAKVNFFPLMYTVHTY